MALYDLDNRIRAFGESRRLNVGTAAKPRWITNIHAGDDYAATYGQDRVLAVCSGTVSYVGWSSTYGNQVHVRVSSSLVIRYHSLAGQSALKVGTRVVAGETFIGFTGKSASGASGNHVHIQAEVNGKPVDPRPYISGGAAGGSSRPFDNTEEDMPLTDADINKLLNYKAYTGGPTFSQVLKDLDSRTAPEIAKAVWWGTFVDRPAGMIPALQELANTGTAMERMSLQQKALSEAVSVLAVANGLDPEKLTTMIAGKVDAVLADNFAAIPDAVRTNIKGAL